MTSPTAPQSSWLDDIPARLADIERAHLLRRRRVVEPAGGARLWVDGQPMLAFCSNDYLGLASHPALAQAAYEATHRFGVGSGGSPLVSGYSAANDALEHDLAAYVQLPRALYFYAGYATNTGIIPALPGCAGSATRRQHRAAQAGHQRCGVQHGRRPDRHPGPAGAVRAL